MNNQEEKQIWESLLSCKRINDLIDEKEEDSCRTDPRNPFERDCDRITYSYPFRRLQDKTQVIPLPVIDFVHTRLTHSLEVTTVGRSLGRLVEDYLLKKGVIESEMRGDIPAILSASCLAHDIGNPPFGHSGEDSISEYFNFGNGQKYIYSFCDEYSVQNAQDLSPTIKAKDLQNFEGNAMGFKILTTHNGRGLNLTCATLATFTKYPRQSYIEGEVEGRRWNSKVSQKKYGFFFAEKEIFRKVAEEVGLVALIDEGGNLSYARHPLAFLMEAADDICYRIIDLEDGFRIGRVPFSEAEIAMKKIAHKDERFNQDEYNILRDEKMKFSYLRAKTINYLVHQVFDAFKSN